jgi:hypothetical protein
MLQNLQAEMFRETTFPGMDALVAFIPKGQDTPSEVKQTVDDAGSSRWFPHEGGWKVICPYFGQDFDPDLFTIEAGGWKHEHCDGCQSTISVGDSCWVAETQDESFIICGNCHSKLETKGE